MDTKVVKYRNGNYDVYFNTVTGTKIRLSEDDTFIPEFPESIDMTVTYKCDNGCPYCYAGCDENGIHADFNRYNILLDSLHEYTELAINGNDLTHPGLESFLIKMKDKKVIVNMTVSQRHFEQHHDLLKSYIDNKLIHGIGISLSKMTEEFAEKLNDFPTAVIHVINGIFSEKDYDDIIKYKNGEVKLLVLGFKDKGRGAKYLKSMSKVIKTNQDWLANNLEKLFSDIRLTIFDNNALEQLLIKDCISSDLWDNVFMGQEGSATMFVDLVNGTYSISSSEKSSIVLKEEDTVNDIFKNMKAIYSVEDAIEI